MADITMFATKNKANEGVLFPVEIDKVKLPMALKLYGDDSDVVHDYNKQKLRKLKINSEGADLEEMMDSIMDSEENIIVRIGGAYSYDIEKQEVIDEPLILFDKEIKCNKKSYEYLIDKIPALKDFILKKSNTRSNFLEGRKEN